MTAPATLSDALAVIAERDKTIAELGRSGVSVERVARAICKRLGYDPDEVRHGGHPEEGTWPLWAEFSDVEAAIVSVDFPPAALSQIEAKGGE